MYSCARSKKLLFFVSQYSVEQQLCCSLIIISLFINPACKKHSIIRNPKGITFPYFLTSPIITAHILPFFRTRNDSSATFFISDKKSSTASNEISPSIPLLYLMIFAYGGCVQIKSIRLSLIKCKSVAFPFRVNIFELDSYWNCKFVSDIETDCGLMSTPTA